MLAVTPDAATLVRRLVSGAALPEAGGLRIVTDPTWRSLSMATAAAPAPEEAVVSAHGAQVFLSSSVARKLSSTVLCAEISDAEIGSST